MLMSMSNVTEWSCLNSAFYGYLLTTGHCMKLPFIEYLQSAPRALCLLLCSVCGDKMHLLVWRFFNFLCSDIFLTSAFWIFISDARFKALFSSRSPTSKFTYCQIAFTNATPNHTGKISVSSIRKRGVKTAFYSPVPESRIWCYI